MVEPFRRFADALYDGAGLKNSSKEGPKLSHGDENVPRVQMGVEVRYIVPAYRGKSNERQAIWQLVARFPRSALVGSSSLNRLLFLWRDRD
jgi:hypothetical protein